MPYFPSQHHTINQSWANHTIMKTTALFSLLFFILLASKPFSGGCEPLFDSSGSQVRVGNSYFLIPDSPSVIGLGLGLWRRYHTCPVDVVQVVNPGLPLELHPADQRSWLLEESADVNIQFLDYVQTPCKDSLSWKVDNSDTLSGKRFITIGGGSTRQNAFKFKKVSSRKYKIVHCSSGSGSACSDVGVYGWDGQNRLALTNGPTYFTFVNAEKCGKVKNNISAE